MVEHLGEPSWEGGGGAFSNFCLSHFLGRWRDKADSCTASGLGIER